MRVEQNARAAVQLADCGYVLESDGVLLRLPRRSMANNKHTIESHLGPSVRHES